MKTHILFISLLTCFLLGTNHIQAQYIWQPENKRWTDNGTYQWTLTARTGYLDSNHCYTQVVTFDPYVVNKLCPSDPAKKTEYFISDYIPGFIEFLPSGYGDPANSQKTYPLILFLPGCGEIQHGVFYTHPNDQPNYSLGLGRLFSTSGYFNSPPTWCRENGPYFSGIPVKTPGQLYNYSTGPKQPVIVMSLIFNGGAGLCVAPYPPGVEDIDKAIDFAKRTYRIDPQRIYLTGMSQGGVMPWEFPTTETRNKLAASVPVAGYGTNVNTPAQVQKLMDNGTQVFSIVNQYDYNTNGRGVDVINWTEIATNTIESYPGGSNYLRKMHFIYQDPDPTVPYGPYNQFYNSSGGLLTKSEVLAANIQNHDAWARTYVPRNSENVRPGYNTVPVYNDGVNDYTIYEWMVLNRNLNAPIFLPVNVSSFTAVRNDAGVELQWVTSTESNSETFIIERSSDGNNYVKHSSLPAAGNSTIKRTYTYQDRALPNSKYVYYRLLQKDKDGKLQVIGVKKVMIGSQGFNARLFPTLATSSVSFEMQSVENEQLTLRIVDMSGKVLNEKILPPRQLRITIDISSLAKGVYFLQAFNSNNRFTTKFIKE